MIYTIQKKIESKGKIVGAVIYESISNRTFNIKKEDFKKYNYSNAKITSDDKIISKNNIPIVSLENVKRKTNPLILYHGSYNKFVKPVFGKGNDKHGKDSNPCLLFLTGYAFIWKYCILGFNQGRSFCQVI